MKRRYLMLGAMWVAALGAMGIILYAQQQSPAPPDPTEARRAPVLRPSDRAPRQQRAKLPVRPLEKGPPRTFRNDRRHTGRTVATGPLSADVAWSYATQNRITGQAVVGRDGTLYFGSHDHHLYAVRAHGTLAWRRNLGDRIYAT